MPVVVYTDACGPGHIGAVIVVDGIRYTHQTHVPPWFMRSIAGIFELELTACLLGLILAAFYAPGRPVLLCCDNMGARGEVVRGACATVLGRMLSSTFWNVAAHFGCAVRGDFVASGLNSADPPSRACELVPADDRAADISAGTPSLFLHIMSTRQNISSDQFRIDPGTLKLVNIAHGRRG